MKATKRRDKKQELIDALGRGSRVQGEQIEKLHARIRVLEGQLKRAEWRVMAKAIIIAGQTEGIKELRRLAEEQGVTLPDGVMISVRKPEAEPKAESGPDTSDTPESDDEWFRRAKLKLPKQEWRVVKTPDGKPKEISLVAKLRKRRVGTKAKRKGNGRKTRKLGNAVDKSIGAS